MRRKCSYLVTDGVHGQVTIPNGLVIQSHERDTAARLAKNGFSPTFRPISSVPGVKNPDVLLDDEIWEMKSPTGSSARTIDRQFERAGKQAPRLILDTNRTELPDDEIIETVEHRLLNHTTITKVIMVTKDGSIRIFTR